MQKNKEKIGLGFETNLRSAWYAADINMCSHCTQFDKSSKFDCLNWLLGEVFTSRAIEPIFLSSCGMPTSSCPFPIPAHVSELVEKVKPHTSEGIRVGKLCVLPALFAGVLPQGGKDRLSQYVRGLVTAASSNETWVLNHKKVCSNRKNSSCVPAPRNL